MRTFLVVALLGLSGCSLVTDKHPYYLGDFDCKGKGVVTVTGNLQIGAGYGGGGSSQGTIQADCGDGFSIHHERSRVVPPPPTTEPIPTE